MTSLSLGRLPELPPNVDDFAFRQSFGNEAIQSEEVETLSAIACYCLGLNDAHSSEALYWLINAKETLVEKQRKGMEPISKNLSNVVNITSFFNQRTNLENDETKILLPGMEELADAALPKIQSLSIRGDDFIEKIPVGLGRFLERSKVVSHVSLSILEHYSGKAKTKLDFAPIAQGLRKNQSMRRFSIDFFEIGDSGVNQIIAAVRNSTVQLLELYISDMTDEGAKALVNLFQEQEKKEREKRLIIGVRLPETIESALQNLIANLKRGQSDPRALGLL